MRHLVSKTLVRQDLSTAVHRKMTVEWERVGETASGEMASDEKASDEKASGWAGVRLGLLTPRFYFARYILECDYFKIFQSLFYIIVPA